MVSQKNLKSSFLRNLEKAINLTSYFFSNVLQTFFQKNGDFQMDSEVSKDDFQINDFVVYPSHGVGQRRVRGKQQNHLSENRLLILHYPFESHHFSEKKFVTH